MSENLLLKPVQYKTDITRWGQWRRHLYSDGRLYSEFESHGRLLGLPLLHYTWGVCPETGRRKTARGIVAVGRIAVGGLAIGQAAFGVIAVGQLAIGMLFGLGQAATGVICVGQLAIALLFGLGQLTTGYVAIGQIAFGYYVLAQVGIGVEVIDMRGASPAAVTFFKSLVSWRNL